MLASMQTFVQRRYTPLLMGFIGLGFVVLLIELIGYQHFEGAQIIGTAATVIGGVAAFLGIGAKGGLRRGLAILFIVLSLVGLFGLYEHNEERLGGEGERRPQGQENRPPQGEPGEGQSGGFEPRIPAPVLAPLSLSGLAALAAVGLLGRRDD